MKGYKVTLSGSYRTANNEIVDFEKLTGIVPYADRDVVEMHIRSRHAGMWIQQNKEKYPDRFYGIREVHVDDMVEVKDAKFSYIGKDIKEMDFDELQDMSIAFDLREVPLFKIGSVREARVKAYADYSTKVLNKPLDHRSPDFNFSRLPSLKVKEGSQRDLSRKMSNEEILEEEANNTGLRRSAETSAMSLDDLKEIAAQKGIKHHPNIGYDALYSKLYGGE